MLYLLPWQGQSIVPSAILSTVQPMWVQIALKPLNCPAVGWVTTTFSAVKIFPPPTGISLVVPSAELSPELSPDPELPDPAVPPAAPPGGFQSRAGFVRHRMPSINVVSCRYVPVLRSAGRMGLPSPDRASPE